LLLSHSPFTKRQLFYLLLQETTSFKQIRQVHS
jgi:hypothetical protein